MKLPSRLYSTIPNICCAVWALVLLSGSRALGEETGKPVTSLKQDNIDNFLSTHGVVFVNFYADWCRFSQILAPVFEETAKKIKELYSGDQDAGKVAFGKVDCDQENGIATRFHISKYPTLKLFRNGQIVKKEYRGQRSVDALTEYIKGQVKDLIKKYSHIDELDELEYRDALTEYIKGQVKDLIKKYSHIDELDELEENKRHMIGYFEDENTDTYKTFQRVSSQLRDDCQFHALVGEAAASERQGTDKVAFRPPKTHRQDRTYPGDISNYDKYLEWAQDNCVPLVREITFENAEELTEEGLPFLILFHRPEDTAIVELFTKTVSMHLLNEKSNVNFLTADGLKFSHPLHHLGKSQADLPVLAIDSFRHMYLFKHDVRNDLDKPGLLNQFVADLHSGKLHREFHHGPDPTPAPPAEIEVQKAGHIPHDPSEKPKEPTSPPESSFVKLAPSDNRYTILRQRDEL